MALDVKIKAEDSTEYTLTVERVDQRISLGPTITKRPGQQLPRGRPARSTREVLFIVTGRATQSQKDNLESASKTWFTNGSGSTQGRVRFTWGENNSGNPYNCVLLKLDIWKEGKAEKYEYLMELEEVAYS